MAVLDDTLVVGRNGAVTMEDVGELANELGAFTRAQLAARAGVKPIALGRFLHALLELGLVAVEPGGIYRATGVEPFESEVETDEASTDDGSSVPDQLGPSPERVRDALVALGRYTIPELASYLGVTNGAASELVAGWLERGAVVDTGKVWKGRPLLEYAPPEHRGSKAPLQRQAPEVEAVAHFAMTNRGGQVTHGGCPRVSKNKDVQALVEKAWRAGWPVRPSNRGGHAQILPPKGRPITVPGTPSGGMIRVFRDRLQEHGLNVKGRAAKPSKGIGQPRVRSDVGRAAIAQTGAGTHGGTKKARNKRARREIPESG